LVTTSRKIVPTVNNILPTTNYTFWCIKKETGWWINEDQEWVGVSTVTKIVLTHRKKSCYVEVHVLADCRVTWWCNNDKKWMVRVTTAAKLMPTQQF
jgi:hypothetical protein